MQARLIVQLKDNQPSLLQKVETACASQRPVSSHTSVCTGATDTKPGRPTSSARPLRCRNRVEVSHQIYRPRHPRGLASNAKTGLWSSTSEVAYYVANSAVRRASPPPQSGTIGTSRTHCTTLVTSLPGRSTRIRRNPGVFVRLRSFAYNVLCRNRTSSFSQDRYAAALAGFSALANWCFS